MEQEAVSAAVCSVLNLCQALNASVIRFWRVHMQIFCITTVSSLIW